MRMYVGIDLHSNNNFVAILNEERETVICQRFRNELGLVVDFLEPYRNEIVSVAVESTYNWYWLVDGLADVGYDMHLVNTTKASNYNAFKYTDDKHDARWIAHLLALGILPEGHITPREQRGVRDLLRRRAFMVHKRTAFLLSLKTIFARTKGHSVSVDDIQRWSSSSVRALIADEMVAESIEVMLPPLRSMDRQIREIEKLVSRRTKRRKEHDLLQTVPGIGLVLAMTILLETGDIGRFPSPGDFASYCRCASAKRMTNFKSKGEGNRKNGNKYLSWAFAEAAHHITRYDAAAKAYYDRKCARSHPMVARRALANKLARACFFIMRDHVPFDQRRIFV